MDNLTITLRDGAQIAAGVFTPAGTPRGSVVIGAAMGVPQAYYAPFAQWLCSQGWHVSTFDFRGVGASLALTPKRRLRGYQATLLDWARDYEAVVAHARSSNAHGPLYLIGHSLSAQLPGFFEQPQRIDGLLGVAAGSGYWRDTAPGVRRAAPLFWHLIVPLATRFAGYFPGKRLGMVGDLPSGVVRQWRQWCLHPQYSVGVQGEAARHSYANVRFPIMALSIADDEMVTHQGIEHLLALYTSAPGSVRRISPQEFGVRRIGHLGAFRSEQQAALWPTMQHWLSHLTGENAA